MDGRRAPEIIPVNKKPSDLFHRIALPEPQKRIRQSLPDHFAIHVARVPGEGKLVVVPLRLQRGGHPLIGEHPVMVLGLRRLIAIVMLAHFQPDAERFGGVFGDQMLVIFPGAMRRIRVRRTRYIRFGG